MDPNERAIWETQEWERRKRLERLVKRGAYPFKSLESCGIVICGRMAEWSIAAVLKTAGLTAPGVRIPLLPLEVVATKPRCLLPAFLYYVRENYLRLIIYFIYISSRAYLKRLTKEVLIALA